MTINAIVRRLGVARNTVRAVAAVVDAVEPEIRKLLSEFPDMAATVVAERIGWEHSIRVVVRDIIADAVAARQDTAGLDVRALADRLAADVAEVRRRLAG